MNRGTSDADLKDDILSELKYEPGVKTSDIGVLVKGGTVTLNGYTSTYWEKANAIRAAKRVTGVHSIADAIQVRLPGSMTRNDGDIAASAGHQIKLSPAVPDDAVKVTVRDGWITLEGDVEWWNQKNAAEQAVHYLMGVKGVSNLIAIKPKLSAVTIESDIHAAFRRNSMLDADKVTVETSGNTVTLSGKVRTIAEREEADRVAWAAPGVVLVINELTVLWSLVAV
ncbi:MAG: BON domain-containing protein [Fimbriimonas sp.]|nr:BON domain-containing protein [Fimbriimonas sp.]